MTWRLLASTFEATQRSSLDDKKMKYRAYYNEQVTYIRKYFKIKGYKIADTLLDVLLELKGGPGDFRKDLYTPQYGHEIDQVLAKISAIENGLFDIEETEGIHGSLENLITATLVHDLGEDLGMMPDDLVNLTRDRRRIRTDMGPIEEKDWDLIDSAANSMERLTHDRQYSVDEFKRKFEKEFMNFNGRSLNIPVPDNEKDIVELDEATKNFLWKKMNVLRDHGNENFQAFVKIDKHGIPKITVTRYGKSHGWGRDWNIYIRTVMKKAYDASVKFGDSANGMTSRLSIENFTAAGYERYLRKRAQLFSINDAAWRLGQSFPFMAKEISSIGGMMGMSYIFGQIFITHHPEMNDEGESGFSASALLKDENGVIEINPYDYFERAFDAYRLVPGLSHPISRFMQQYRDVVTMYEGQPWHKEVKELYEQTRMAIIKHAMRAGIELEHITQLIDEPETYNPMPNILQSLRNENRRNPSGPDPMPVRDPG